VQHEKLEKAGISLKLPVVTRWASTYISMHSVLANKSACHAFAVHERFSTVLPKTKNGRNLAREIKEKVIYDNKWETIQTAHDFLKPFTDAIQYLSGQRSSTFSNTPSSFVHVLFVLLISLQVDDLTPIIST
jgi:hypothetical protein